MRRNEIFLRVKEQVSSGWGQDTYQKAHCGEHWGDFLFESTWRLKSGRVGARGGIVWFLSGQLLLAFLIQPFLPFDRKNDHLRDDSPPPPPPPPAPRKTSRRVNEVSILSRRRSQKEAGGSSNPPGGTSLWSSGSLKRPTKPVRTTVASRARSLSPRSVSSSSCHWCQFWLCRTATRESVSMRSYTSTIRKDSFSAKRIWRRFYQVKRTAQTKKLNEKPVIFVESAFIFK